MFPYSYSLGLNLNGSEDTTVYYILAAISFHENEFIVVKVLNYVLNSPPFAFNFVVTISGICEYCDLM